MKILKLSFWHNPNGPNLRLFEEKDHNLAWVGKEIEYGITHRIDLPSEINMDWQAFFQKEEIIDEGDDMLYQLDECRLALFILMYY